jgi:hypothetical protein
MVRHIDRRSLLRVTESLALACLVTLGLVTQARSSQTGDSTASAKAHYQNAVTAIGKSDWRTAKSELLAAEKLAPQNALIHYDLALAYSHLGEKGLARTEVAKALQLGLPVEQKKAAQDLKRILLPESGNAEPRTEPPQPVPVFKAPPKSGSEPSTPSIEETLSYLNARVDSAFVKTDASYIPGQFSVSPDRRSLWWSRFMPYNCCFGYDAFFEAKITDLDANTTVYDNSGDIVIDCKGSECWRQWTTVVNNIEGNIITDKFRERLLRAKYKPDNSTLAANVRGLSIPTTGDAEVAARFVRALAHLVRLMQELPENRNLGADDPFKQ